ncbi:MAG: SprT family zinc-dependent metalloprotease [bacterium]|nr:SprT family zinc-dependent metalloprotease [bacterium]
MPEKRATEHNDQLEFAWGLDSRGGTAVPDIPAPSAAPKLEPVASPEPDDVAPARAWTGRSLQRTLCHLAGMHVEVRITDNVSTVMSMRPLRGLRGGVALRLHHMFLDADRRIVKALAVWMKQPKRKTSAALLNDYIRANGHLLKKAAPRRIFVRARGRHFDLKRLYEEVNRDHFDGKMSAHITWGKYPTKRAKRRSIRFGSYHFEHNLIRIHPYLDQEFVPEFFVRYVIYHELLHAHLGVKESATGRRMAHTAEFRRLERAYPGYEQASAWENDAAIMKKILGARK